MEREATKLHQPHLGNLRGHGAIFSDQLHLPYYLASPVQYKYSNGIPVQLLYASFIRVSCRGQELGLLQATGPTREGDNLQQHLIQALSWELM